MDKGEKGVGRVAVELAEELIRNDDKQEFIKYLGNQAANDTISILLSDLLELICQHRAHGCASALLDENVSGIKIYVNEPMEELGGISPLGLAAESLCYQLTEMFLNHETQTSENYVPTQQDLDDELMLHPLRIALRALSNQEYVDEWVPEKSIYKLFYIFCFPELKESLDTIKLLASNTKEVKRIGFSCVEKVQLVELAALLLVAWDKFAPDNKEMKLPIFEVLSEWKSNYAIDQELNWLCRRMEALVCALRDTHHVIEDYRNSEDVKSLRKHEVPLSLGSNLSISYSEDIVSHDIDCLRPQPLPAEKASLEVALETIMTSRSTISGPISFTPRSDDHPVYPSDDELDDGSDPDPEDALIKDDRNGFLSLIEKAKSLNNVDEMNYTVSRARRLMFQYDCINCVRPLLDDGTDRRLYLDGPFEKGWTSMHLAARAGSPRLTKWLLENGFSADERSDCVFSGILTKDVLPLDMALNAFRSQLYMRRWPETKSVIDLVVELCQYDYRNDLETVRLLVQKTKGVKNEFFNYLKQGKVIEVCALLMVAHKELLLDLGSLLRQPDTVKKLPLFPSVHGVGSTSRRSYYTTAEQSHQLRNGQLVNALSLLFLIFERIGDQLAAYIRLDEKRSYAIQDLEVKWLMEKAGIPIYGEVNVVNCTSCRAFGVKWLELFNQLHLGKPQSLNGMANHVSRGICTSTLKAPGGLALVDSVAPPRRLASVAHYRCFSKQFTSMLSFLRRI